VLLDSRGGPERVLRHPAGFLAAEVAWAPDGSTFAACFETAGGAVLEIRPLGGTGLHGDGLCFPTWVDGRGLAAARLSPLSIELAGETVLGPGEIAVLLPELPEGARREVSALGAGGEGELAAALVVVNERRRLPFSGLVAVLSQEGSATVTLPDGALPTALGLAPDGTALWFFDAGEGRAVVVSYPGGEPVDSFPQARWVAWAPSGRFVAAATGDGVEIMTWPELERVAVVPVAATDLSWTSSSG
jgi:hypothetical protein